MMTHVYSCDANCTNVYSTVCDLCAIHFHSTAEDIYLYIFLNSCKKTKKNVFVIADKT